MFQKVSPNLQNKPHSTGFIEKLLAANVNRHGYGFATNIFLNFEKFIVRIFTYGKLHAVRTTRRLTERTIIFIYSNLHG